MIIEHQKLLFNEVPTSDAMAQIETLLAEGWTISTLWMIRPQPADTEDPAAVENSS